LWWVLIAYFVIRLLRTENPRWWLAIGAVAGVGMQSKYTMAFLLCGVVAGVLFTRARRFLLSGWLWAGAGVALAIFLPNLIWQVRHGFISLHFLQYIHARDVGEGRTKGFFTDQFRICTSPVAAPLWIAGLLCYLRDRRYRMLAWMYLTPLALFIIGKGRGYYLGAAYPMLIAMGAVAGERWLGSLRRIWARTLEAAFFTGLAAYAMLAGAIVIPVASHGPLMKFALANNGDFREEIGWKELVKAGGGNSRFAATGATHECGRACGELWRAGRGGTFGAKLRLAAAHQHDQFGVAARLSHAAAGDSDCGWVFAQICGAHI